MSEHDHKLLQNYVRTRSDAAFEAISSRYVDLVYSSALRLSGDAHQAEDITQAVFVVLAERAPQLKPPLVLPAWLLTVTRLTAANLRRSENTQRKGKQSVMNALEAPRTPPPDEWEDIAPFLDDALAQLNEHEREAIALRYFQHEPLEKVGAELGVSADAARKRLDRALEKLRRFFALKGVAVGATTLPMLIGSFAVHSAPTALASAVPAAVVAAHAGSHLGSITLLSKGTLKVMAISATQKTLFTGAACLTAVVMCSAIAVALTATPDKQGPSLETARPEEKSPPPVKPTVQESPTVNLFERTDAAADAINGSWSYEDGVLRSGEKAFARYEFPYVPPEEYDFTIDFTVDVVREDVVMLVSKNGADFCWKMGMAQNRFCAFEYIGSVDNPDQRTRVELGKVFQPGQRYKATVKVRNANVSGFLDDKLISSYDTNFKSIFLPAKWKVGTRGCLGIGTLLSKVTVHSAKVTEVKGHGQVLRKEGDKPLPRSVHKMLDDEQWIKAVDLMAVIDPLKDAVAGTWSRKGTTLSCDETMLARIEIPYRPPEEYDFKIVFSRATPGKDLHQFVTLDNKSFVWCLNGWTKYKQLASFQALERSGEYWNTSTVKHIMEYGGNQEHTSIVQVRKKSVAAYLDGTLISEYSGPFGEVRVLRDWPMATPGTLGLGSSGAETVYHKIEVVEVTGKGIPTTTSPIKPVAPPTNGEQSVKPPNAPAQEF